MDTTNAFFCVTYEIVNLIVEIGVIHQNTSALLKKEKTNLVENMVHKFRFINSER